MEDDVCEVALASSCSQLGCDDYHLVNRERPLGRMRAIHFGLMASGNLVMKSAPHRDRIAVEENVIGFEKEGAGVWDSLPTVIIKSVSDYSDSHKNKVWQRYCANVAAASAEGFLSQWRGISKITSPANFRPDLDLLEPGNSNDSFSVRALRSNLDLSSKELTQDVHITPNRTNVPASRRYGGDWSILRTGFLSRSTTSFSSSSTSNATDGYVDWCQENANDEQEPTDVDEQHIANNISDQDDRRTTEYEQLGKGTDATLDQTKCNQPTREGTIHADQGLDAFFPATQDRTIPPWFVERRQRIAEDIILQKLAYRGMSDRYEDLEANYPLTFEWLFDRTKAQRLRRG